MDLTSDDRVLILAGLFELRITHLEHAERCAAIDMLAQRLGGDADAMFFGAELP